MDWESESPELWAFLKSLRRGAIMSGTVSAIERFGVFVDLDDGPGHPTLPGVGFITVPELSWRHLAALTDAVAVGQRVSCVFLGLDAFNAEARLSLRATRPDPFAAFAERTAMGQELRGTVTAMSRLGVFVEVADCVEGLVPFVAVEGRPAAGPAGFFEPGDAMTVVVTEIERERRRLFLRRGMPGPAAG